MKKMVFLFYLQIILVLLFTACKNNSQSVFPQKKELVQSVYASGKIFPVNNYKVVSKVPGYILQIHVNAGDSVNIGDALITIKSEQSILNADQAKNLYELAAKNANENGPLLSALKEDVKSVKNKYELDSVNYTRTENLLKQNATSRSQFDAVKTQFEIAKQNYLKSLYNYTSTRERLNVELQNAKLQYEAQVSNKNEYVITSAVSGKVYDIACKQGDYVNNINLLMELGSGSEFELELNVDETDVSSVTTGQKLLFTIDAYKDVVFNGKIKEVYPRINPANKTSKVLASFDVDKSYPLYSGMSIEANIIIAQKNSALVVPREYLLNGKSLILKNGKDTVRVNTGASDLEYVEIVSGVSEKDELIKPQ